MDGHQTQQQRTGPPAPPRTPNIQQQGGGDLTPILIVLLSFVAIFAMVLVPSVSNLTVSNLTSSLSIVHQVPEGHVGVYWRGGALLKVITDPGFHLKLPMITHFEAIQVTLQTDLVRDIPCGTKGGVMTNFEKIEIMTTHGSMTRSIMRLISSAVDIPFSKSILICLIRSDTQNTAAVQQAPVFNPSRTLQSLPTVSLIEIRDGIFSLLVPLFGDDEEMNMQEVPAINSLDHAIVMDRMKRCKLDRTPMVAMNSLELAIIINEMKKSIKNYTKEW